MPNLDWPRPSASALLLTNLGEENGVPAAVVLRDSGVTFEMLADTHTTVSGWQEMRIVRNLLGAMGDAASLGVEVSPHDARNVGASRSRVVRRYGRRSRSDCVK